MEMNIIKALFRAIGALIGVSAIIVFLLVATVMLFVFPPVGVFLLLLFFVAMASDRRRA